MRWTQADLDKLEDDLENRGVTKMWNDNTPINWACLITLEKIYNLLSKKKRKRN